MSATTTVPRADLAGLRSLQQLGQGPSHLVSIVSARTANKAFVDLPDRPGLSKVAREKPDCSCDVIYTELHLHKVDSLG